MRGSSFLILIVAVLIAAIGISCIYSSTYQRQAILWQDIYKRQALWAILGLVFFVLASRFNYRRFLDATYFLYAVAILLLLVVFVAGVVRLGAQRWLRLGWFNFQPSEFAKLIVVLFLAKYLSRKSVHDLSLSTPRLGMWRGFILPFIFILIPIGLIIEQPDLGSALMILFIFLAMLYLSGIRLKYLLIFFFLAILSLPVLWLCLKGYQKERLLVFLNPNIDPLGAGYTIIQSKIAIGSGGFFGKGWLSGTQSQLRFLPESHTDFVFATFAEEWGFLGVCVLFLLYYLLINEGIRIGLRTQDSFGRLLAFGISFMLCIQVFINVMMTLGLAPVVGLPLPLMSYGGSSMLVTFISLGILSSIDRRRAVF